MILSNVFPKDDSKVRKLLIINHTEKWGKEYTSHGLNICARMIYIFLITFISVCLEVPRVGTGLAIYGCRNGHLLCQGCVDKIQECPICR